MRDEIFNALTTKFEGVDAKILGRIADKLAKTSTEQDAATIVEGVTFQNVLESYGDSRATDATKTAVLNYEKKYGIKEGKPKQTAQTSDKSDDNNEGEGNPAPVAGQTKNDDEAPAWAKALSEQLKALSDRTDAIEKGKLSDSRRQRLNGAIANLSALQKKPYSRVKYDDMSDDEFDEMMGAIEQEVKEFAEENAARGATFGAPFGGQHNPTAGEATDTELNDLVERLKI